MTGLQRIRSIIIGCLMMACGILILVIPNLGYGIVALILSVAMLLYGIRTLVYYFTMARNMVGGRGILYIGVIVLDLGIFTLTIADNGTVFIIIYLLTIHLFSGLVDILRALEAKRILAPFWKHKLSYGIVNIVIAVAAFISGVILRSTDMLVYIYSAGLIYSAISRIITAFRKTAIVYIQ